MRRIYRFIFSRYFFSAVLILLELTVIALWSFDVWENSIYAIAVGFAVNLVAIISLITKDTNPEYKIPWLLILITVPLFGAVLYVLFYSRPMRKKEARLMMDIYNEIDAFKGEKEQFDEVFEELKKENPLVAGKALSILNDDAFSRIYRNSRCKYFPSGEEYYSALLERLESARSFIFLEYFIISEGKLWDSIHAVLKRKARDGVEIRLMYDDIGCMKTLPRGYEQRLSKEGIRAICFNKVSPSLSTVHNNRNHRKICIIDGKYAFTGGVNIADEYINEKERFGHWKDGGVMIEGEAVEGFLIQFMCDWSLVRRAKENFDKYLSTAKKCEKCDTGYYIPFASGPKPTYERQVGKRVFLNIINQAERYVYITTPYLVIDYDLTESLRGAALRGVDVRIITPSVPDKKIVKIMTKSSYPYLMECGVKIYEYSPGFIHEKLLVCDDEIAVTGTINFDYRSLVHHFENALWLYASPQIPRMRDEFLKTVSMSDERDDKEARLTFIEWLIRNIVRVFAPLL